MQPADSSSQYELDTLSQLSLDPPPYPSLNLPPLPIEILLTIFRLALDEDDDFSRRCITKLACAQVCRTWRDASEVGLGYLVNGVEQAGKLARLLRTAEDANGPRTLEVNMEPTKSIRQGNEVAHLVSRCTGLVGLVLIVSMDAEPTSLTQAPFGPALGAYLEQTRWLRTLCVGLGATFVHHSFFCRILPNLTHLVDLQITGNVIPPANPTLADEDNDHMYDLPSLRFLHLNCASSHFTNSILWAAYKTLRDVSIAAINVNYPSTWPPLAPLLDSVGGLEQLQLPDAEWNTEGHFEDFSLHTALSRNKATLESLTIGVNLINFNELLEHLPNLTALQHLSITCNHFTQSTWFPDISFTSFISYLDSTSALRTVILPRQLCQARRLPVEHWSDADVASVKVAAEKKGIELVFV